MLAKRQSRPETGAHPSRPPAPHGTRRAAPRAVSQSVSDTLQFEEDRWSRTSETLAANIQIVLIATLLVFFVVTPAPQDRTGVMNATLVALGLALAIATLRRVTIGMSARSTIYAAVLSILDAAVICGVIWSYHLQYNLPLGAVLKSPTFAYVFVFLCLRAFSLRPQRVVLSGLAFATGWMALVVLAEVADPQGALRTSSFSAYVTTANRLVGAEVDKGLAILLFTVALAFLAHRARSLIAQMVMVSAAARDAEAKARLDELSRLTATVAHEIRNPLNAMRSASYIVARKTEGTNLDIAKPVERINNGIERCNTIITRLLDFTRERSTTPEAVALDDWLQRIVSDATKSAADHIRVEFHPGSNSAVVLLDNRQMSQAITNIVENAMESIADQAIGHIVISSAVTDRGVELIVADNGPGIDDALRDEVLKPLYSTKGFGLGLGLPMAEQIARQHDGGLEISQNGDAGTRVALWFAAKSGTPDQARRETKSS